MLAFCQCWNFELIEHGFKLSPRGIGISWIRYAVLHSHGHGEVTLRSTLLAVLSRSKGARRFLQLLISNALSTFSRFYVFFCSQHKWILKFPNFEYYPAGCAILEYGAAFWVWRSLLSMAQPVWGRRSLFGYEHQNHSDHSKSCAILEYGAAGWVILKIWEFQNFPKYFRIHSS